MTELIHRIYASVGSPNFLASEIPALLQHTRASNEKRGITGMLLFVDRSFFQVLEGEPGVVDRVYSSIAIDPRHTRITEIIREPIFQRSFPDWTMGFTSINVPEAGQLLGENDFFTGGDCLLAMNSGRARKLLSAFREGRWRADQTGVNRAVG